MDAGPAKVRRRLTAEVSKYKMSFQLTLSQVETLDLFFQNDIKGGALRFDMPHPRTGNIVKMRITGPPQYRALGGEMFEARVEMEEMP
jgi:hypothetical protein